jgi:hypothetical protein
LTEKTAYIPGIFNFYWLNPEKDEIANREITITE